MTMFAHETFVANARKIQTGTGAISVVFAWIWTAWVEN